MTKLMSNNMPSAELLSALKNADSILLFGHIAPDGDALGSVLALACMLRGMGKKVQMGADGKIPSQLRFLPGIDAFSAPGEMQIDGTELAIAVDTADTKRLGQHLPAFERAGSHMVIDHHGTNPCFGQINWVDGAAPAAAVLIWRLYHAMEMPITKEAALCLYTALSTDTGNFIYESVDPECFAMMAELMQAGLELAQYSRILFREKRESFVRILSETLPSLRVMDEKHIAGLHTAYNSFVKTGVPDSETDGIVDYAIDLEGVKMAYYAHEKENGDVKFSLRSLPPYRVDQLAVSFGGGGHMQAAGCTLQLPLEEAVAKMEEAMLRSRKEQDGQA